MQFSQTEQKLIRQLQLQHNHWRTTRMITLLGSLVAGIFAITGLVSGSTIYGGIALLGVSAFGMSYALGSWSGRPEVSLLLKLLKENREDEK